MYKGVAGMAGYRRWISYIYSYEEGIKKSNIGYVRVESLGKVTKITVHINVLSVSGSIKTYFFVRSPKGMNGIYIGDTQIDKGVGKGVFRVDSASISGSGHNVSEAGGILIYHNNDSFFASEWDDKPVRIDEFVEISDADENKLKIVETVKIPVESKVEQEVSVNITTAQELAESTSENEEMVEVDNSEQKNDENVLSVNEQSENANIELVKTESMQPDLVMQAGKVQEGTIQERTVREGTVQEVLEDDIAKAAGNMLETYPQMYPFEDDEMLRCVRIEPQDIEKLPIDIWNLAGNSFLLRGYYGYRHLMLMKREDKYTSEYLLGVPGIYHNKDNLIAEMFGFNLFKPMKKTDKVQGEFGYWCIPVGR